MKLDAGCSQGPIQSWDWGIDASAALGGPSTHSGMTVNRNFPQCAGETVNVSLAVTGAGGARGSTSQAIKLPVMLSTLRAEPLRCTITSLLSASGARGNVVFDEMRADSVEGGTPSSHLQGGRRSEREVQAFLVAGSEGLWTFDFSGCEDLVAGSLLPVQGTTVSDDGRRIAFRVEGTPGERIAFRYRLAR